MSIYSHHEYRAALIYSIDRYRRQKSQFTQTKLAEKSGIHNTFISNVFKGRSDFHADQIFSIGEALELSGDEVDFVVDLLEYEKAVHPKRKSQLEGQIKKIREKKLKLGSQLQLDEPDFSKQEEIEYYLNPYFMIVHTALHLNKYALSIGLLAKQLRLSEDYVRYITKRLEEMQFVAYDPKKKSYNVRLGSRHLDKTSALCIPHQTLVRNQGLRQMGEIEVSQRNFFSATFLGSEELRAAIEKEFYKFTKKVKDLADSAADPQGIYQMNFDLFPWTQS
jgi:uncharacterized protein (TIGR02147 family)